MRTLEEIEAAATASTPCRHLHRLDDSNGGQGSDTLVDEHDDEIVWGMGDGFDNDADMAEEDAVFFAAARADVLDLVAKVRELEAEIVTYKVNVSERLDELERQTWAKIQRMMIKIGIPSDALVQIKEAVDAGVRAALAGAKPSAPPDANGDDLVQKAEQIAYDTAQRRLRAAHVSIGEVVNPECTVRDPAVQGVIDSVNSVLKEQPGSGKFKLTLLEPGASLERQMEAEARAGSTAEPKIPAAEKFASFKGGQAPDTTGNPFVDRAAAAVQLALLKANEVKPLAFQRRGPKLEQMGWTAEEIRQAEGNPAVTSAEIAAQVRNLTAIHPTHEAARAALERCFGPLTKRKVMKSGDLTLTHYEAGAGILFAIATIDDGQSTCGVVR